VKKLLNRLAVVALVGMLQGCLFAHVQHPLDTNFEETRLGSKIGRASSHSILWLVAWGDAGTQAAAENGGLKVINHADTETTLILFGLYTEVTTVVYGD